MRTHTLQRFQAVAGGFHVRAKCAQMAFGNQAIGLGIIHDQHVGHRAAYRWQSGRFVEALSSPLRCFALDLLHRQLQPESAAAAHDALRANEATHCFG